MENKTQVPVLKDSYFLFKKEVKLWEAITSDEVKKHDPPPLLVRMCPLLLDPHSCGHLLWMTHNKIITSTICMSICA